MSIGSGPRPPPLEEQKRLYRRNAAVGVVLKSISDREQAIAAEKERKAAIPKVRTERWRKWADEHGKRPPGHDEVTVCRSPGTGRFARLLTPQQLAEHFGLTRGSDIPQPSKKPTP